MPGHHAQLAHIVAVEREQLIAWATWAWQHADGLFVLGSIGAWSVCIGCLSPVVWRVARRRPHYLDPLLGIVMLLALNRQSFLFHVSRTASHGSAMVLALIMAWMAWFYQRHDRAVPR